MCVSQRCMYVCESEMYVCVCESQRCIIYMYASQR